MDWQLEDSENDHVTRSLRANRPICRPVTGHVIAVMLHVESQYWLTLSDYASCHTLLRGVLMLALEHCRGGSEKLERTVICNIIVVVGHGKTGTAGSEDRRLIVLSQHASVTIVSQPCRLNYN